MGRLVRCRKVFSVDITMRIWEETKGVFINEICSRSVNYCCPYFEVFEAVFILDKSENKNSFKILGLEKSRLFTDFYGHQSLADL